MTKLFIILASFALSLPLFSARTVRTIFIQAPRNAPKEAVLFTGQESVSVRLPGRNLSPAEKLPSGALQLAILTSEPVEGEEIPGGAPKVFIPEDWKRVILVFVPAPKNKVFPAKVIAINASKGQFAMGDTMVYNLTRSVFMGKFGKNALRVNPMKSGMVAAPRNDAGAYPVAIDCILRGAKERSVICRTNWMHNPKARQILFVAPSPGQDLPRVWGVLDRTKDGVEEVE
ncbi:MAG: hypothetical protein ACSHX6_00820 [Akkermansiaceae bacterium]